MGACCCIGPQNGQPLCPCRMRGVTIQDGRCIEVIDHGPVPTKEQVEGQREMRRLIEDILAGRLDQEVEIG